MKRFLKESISHLSIIWAAMLLTFWVTDRFNSAMAFINHSMTKQLFGLFALSMLVTALLLATDRTAPLFKLRLIFSLPTFLLAVGTVVLLVIDHSNPRLLLFLSDLVKFSLLGVIIWGLFTAIFGICCRRKAAFTA